LPSAAITLDAGRFQANNLDLSFGNGIDRLTLYQPSQSFTINGTNGLADLGSVGLRVVADSIDLNTSLDAGHVVFETKNTLVVDHPLNAKYDGYVDLRVFGDNSNIILNSPISVSTGNTIDKQGDGWIRLVAPDGAITGSSALTFDAPNSHLIYKAKDWPLAGELQTNLEKLTLAYAAHGRPGDISIVEQDDRHPYQSRPL
jgi:hypothetical protein